jgi:hypothetical protein
MKSEIHDFDSVPDEFEIDGVDGTVVPVANWNRSENTNR